MCSYKSVVDNITYVSSLSLNVALYSTILTVYLALLILLLFVTRPEMVVGWYHSHPGFGCWLSGVDVNTQQVLDSCLFLFTMHMLNILQKQWALSSIICYILTWCLMPI